MIAALGMPVRGLEFLSGRLFTSLVVVAKYFAGISPKAILASRASGIRCCAVGKLFVLWGNHEQLSR